MEGDDGKGDAVAEVGAKVGDELVVKSSMSTDGAVYPLVILILEGNSEVGTFVLILGEVHAGEVEGLAC